MDKFKWIKEYFLTKKASSCCRTSDVVPNIFDDYYFVHWKVGIVPHFPFDLYPEQNETIEQTNKRIRIEREFGLFLNPQKDKLFQEIGLKEISQIFKTPYHYNILNKIKQTPAVKILEEPSKIALKSSLEKIKNHQELNLFIEDIFRNTYDSYPPQEYVGIDIEKYFELQEDMFYDYNTYLFPDDLSWCLTTSEDYPMILGIKKEFTDGVIKNFDMELFKVEYEAKLY